MVVVVQVAKTFAAKVVCRSVPGLLVWCGAIVPTAERPPPGILSCLGYCWYMGSAALANNPPGVAKSCEFGAYHFL